MKREEWIDKAFEKAMMANIEAEKIAGIIGGFLNEHTGRILNDWADHVGSEKAELFAKFLIESEMDDALEDMMNRFCTAGFLLREFINNQNK